MEKWRRKKLKRLMVEVVDAWGIDKGKLFHDACGSSVPDVYGVKGWVSNYIK